MSNVIDIAIVLISRSGNRFLVDGKIRMVSFYIAAAEYTEFYFLLPDRPGGPFQKVTIATYVIADMIKHQGKWLVDQTSISVPDFYW